MTKHSIEISFPNASRRKADVHVQSLGHHLSTIDFGQSGVKVEKVAGVGANTVSAVRLEFAPEVSTNLAAGIKDWLNKSDAHTIRMKMHDGRVLEKTSFVPDDDFVRELAPPKE